MPFQIIRNDITRVKADVIVNTANPEPVVGAGVDHAIYKAAGRERLLKARRRIGHLAPGEVAVTPGYALDAKYIIHVSGPWWDGGDHGEAECLRLCYDRALQQAKEKRCQSIAFPLLATGTYGFPKELGIRIAVEAFTSFLEEDEMEILLVVFGGEDVRISGALAEEVASFVDDDYVAKALSEEYRRETHVCGAPLEEGAADLLGKGIARAVAEPDMMSVQRAGLDKQSAKADNADSQPPRMPSYVGPTGGLFKGISRRKKEASLEETLKEIYTDSFGKHLRQLINKKGLKNSEVYAAANISKQYFSKLMKGQVNPSKEKVLALAVGLRLNLDETVDFLRIAGYALSPISQTDKVVEYFIEHEYYNVMQLDIVLFDYGLDPLSKG